MLAELLRENRAKDRTKDSAKNRTDKPDDNRPLGKIPIALRLALIRRTTFQLCGGRKKHARCVPIEKAGVAPVFGKNLPQVIAGIGTEIGPVPHVVKACDAEAGGDHLFDCLATLEAGTILLGDFLLVLGAILDAMPSHQEMTIEAALFTRSELTHSSDYGRYECGSKSLASIREQRSNAPDIAEALVEGK